MIRSDGVNQNHHSQRDSSDATQGKIRSENLHQQTRGTQQELIERAFANVLREGGRVETCKDHVHRAKRKFDHAVQECDFLEFPTANVGKAPKDQHKRAKFGDGEHHGADDIEHKTEAVLHLRTQLSAEKSKVQLKVMFEFNHRGSPDV